MKTSNTRLVADLTPDPRNANRGTRRGKKALADSLARYGAGRSILIDKNGTVIAGNKTVEEAREAGITEVIVVPTDGTKIVAVQRTDLDLGEGGTARELAYADNRVAELGLDWDADAIAQDIAAGADLSAMWSAEEIAELTGAGADTPGMDPQDYKSVVQYTLVFDTPEQQARFHAFLRALKLRYPDIETIGGRVDAFLAEQSLVVING